MTGLLIEIAYTDWKTKRIPDKLVIFICLAGIVGIWLLPQISVMQRVAGIFVLSVPLFVLACVSKGSIGGGDIKLMAAGGFLLGGYNVFRAFVIGILAAGIWVICLLIVKRAGRKTEIALGPFLCFGMIWVMFGI